MIATLNTNGDICAIQKAGRVGIMHTVIMQCLRIASVKAGDITSKIKNAVSFSFVWLFVGHCVWYHVINSSNYTTYLPTVFPPMDGAERNALSSYLNFIRIEVAVIKFYFMTDV